MVLEIYKSDDEEVKIRSDEFEQILVRQHIYKMPFEIRIIFRQRVYHRRLEKLQSNSEPIKVKVLFDTGYEVEMCILRVENRGELAMISIVHLDVFDLMTNRLKNQDTVYDVKLVDYVTADVDTWWHFREELGKLGLLLRVKEDLTDNERVHISEWEGGEEVVIHSIFRIADIEMKEPISKYAVYGIDEDYYSTEIGNTREIMNFRITKDDIDGLKERLIPIMSIIATGLNEKIQILSKVKIGDKAYGVMGLQRNWKSGNVLTHLILGRKPT